MNSLRPIPVLVLGPLSLVIALVGAGCPGDSEQHAGDDVGLAGDVRTDTGASDISPEVADAVSAEVGADLSEDVSRDPMDPETGHDTQDAVEDVVPDASGDSGDALISLSPTTWTPSHDEEWAVGPCRGVEIPPARVGDGAVGDVALERVGPDGGCLCNAGGCVEIPEGALGREMDYLLRFDASVRDERVALGPRLFVLLAEVEGVDAAWDALRPGSRIRIGIRSYPDSTQEVRAEPVLIESRHLGRGTASDSWQSGGGMVSDTIGAIEFEPHVYRGAGSSVQTLSLGLVGIAENYCGDGVLGPHERCEKGDPANEGLCDIACQPQTWVQCEDGECSRRCPLDFECPDPGPCRVAECDSRVGCVWIPTDEGEACETDEVSGWCQTGHCVETPRDCVECGVHRRWLDGQCREAERQYSWVPEPRTGRVWAEGGVYHAPAIYGLGGTISGDLAGPAPTLGIGDGIVDLEYRASPFTEDGVPQATTFGVDGVAGELESTDGAWQRVRLHRRIELEAADWLHFRMYGPWDFSDPNRFVPGDFDIRRIRYSELGLGICSVGVRHPDADDGWAECVPRVGDAWCGDACVNLLYNRYHCGECGHVCDSGLFCEGGECVREPVWRDYVDTFPDDCPEGYFGLDCTGVCPGVAEDGVACSGNGLCHDGLWGNGHCYCHEDPAYGHGLNCEFSCDDGIRNGLEQNIDCGGGVCDPCD